MPERCGECGTFMRKAKAPAGDYWLCTNCGSDDPLLRAVKEIVADLGLTREDTGAFAFGLADAVDFDEIFTDNKSAQVVAAACVYVASILAENKLTQPDVAEVASVSVTSIRDTHSKIYDGSGFAEHYGPIKAGKRDPDEPNPWFDIDGWREHLASNHSKDAIKASASNVRRFAVWYDGDGKPSVGSVRGWLAYMVDEGFAPTTIEGRFNALRKYLEWADADVDLDQVDVNKYIAQAWENKIEAQ